MAKTLSQVERKIINRRRYYRQYMRQWCKLNNLPWVESYHFAFARAEIIGNVAKYQARLNAGQFPV
jgi:hypothetical protein